MINGFRRSSVRFQESNRKTRLLTLPVPSVSSRCRRCISSNACKCLSTFCRVVSTTPWSSSLSTHTGATVSKTNLQSHTRIIFIHRYRVISKRKTTLKVSWTKWSPRISTISLRWNKTSNLRQKQTNVEMPREGLLKAMMNVKCISCSTPDAKCPLHPSQRNLISS